MLIINKRELKEGLQASQSFRRTSRACAPRFALMFLVMLCAAFAAGCRQDMQNQPRYKPYRKSDFFYDGLSSRKPPENTVARGYLRDDTHLYTGKNPNANSSGGAAVTQNAPNSSAQQNAQNATNAGQQGSANSGANAPAAQSDPNNVDTFPFPVTMEVLERGRERYNIFCSMCHGATGYGDGMVVRRGYKKPPSYHEDRLRQQRVGHFFDVITNGWATMPSYAPQIPVRDRWAIVAYIRALQASQQGTEADVPADKRNQLNGGDAQPEGGGEGN